MTNFDNFVSDVKVVAGEVGKKAGEYMEISKLYLERVTVKGDIQKNFSKMGELVYEKHRTGEENNEVIGIYIDETDDQYRRLDEITARIAEMQRRARCPACGAQNEVGAAYCSRCGTKLGNYDEKTAEKAKENSAAHDAADDKEKAADEVTGWAENSEDRTEVCRDDV